MELKNSEVFAVVDCNNFFVSCERVFRPDLKNTPVVVLSNNDGCAVSRSQEAKALGIPMGAPHFKWKEIAEKNNIEVFSSNFALYGDFSKRIMSILSTFTSEIEIYSIDEAFLSLKHIPAKDYALFCKTIRETVLQWTGIPVSIGIAPTKTLSKVADKLAKHEGDYEGVLNFSTLSEQEIDRYLERFPVGDVWGVGWKSRRKLQSHEIMTAKDLKYADTKWIKKEMSIMGVKTVMELRGISCIPLEEVHDIQKGIMCTRGFGRYVESMDELAEAVSLYTARACEKLRSQNAIASYITVYIRTNKHNPAQKQYYNALTIPLENPSSFTPTLTNYALNVLKKIYKKGYRYNKAGVLLGGILPEGYTQDDLFLFTDKEQEYKGKALMDVMDRLNKKYGRNTVYLASEGTKHNWIMKQDHRSPRYTTSWNELLEVNL